MPTPPPPAPTPPPLDGLSALRDEAQRLRITLDDATAARFAHYLELLIEGNDRAGLTAVTDSEAVQRRHFGEALALCAALRDAGVLPEGAPALVADLGPGGGFPGVPMALVEPALQLVLIEAQERRCVFLRELVAALPVPGARVLHARAEEAGRDPSLRGTCDLVVARALAALPVLVEYALPLLREGGVLAAPKGSRALDELAEAQHAIAELGGEALPPVRLPLADGQPEQHVILVRRTGRLDDRYPRRPGIPAKRPL